MDLTQFEFLNGLLSLILVISYVIIGIRIILKYFNKKERIYLLFGLSWALMVQGWYGSGIAFILIVIFGTEGLGFELFSIISLSLYPFTLMCWLGGFTDLNYKEKQNIILLIAGIIGALFEIFFLYFLFTDPSIIGEPFGPGDVSYGMLVSVYLGTLILTFLITGVIFANRSIKTNEPEIKLRGKFLMSAIIAFAIGAFMDNLPNFSIILLIIARLLLIISAFEFYCAFVLPNALKKRLLRET